MQKPIAVFLLAVIVAFAIEAEAVTIAWTPVGNPGNTADPAAGSLYGAVGYNYSIDKYDVTNSQYVEMLNAKDPTGANSLGMYDPNMTAFGGINYNSGNASGSKYSVNFGDGNHPVNWVDYYDALRFANWLNNGEGNGDTETGAYTLGPLVAGGFAINANSITRNAGATVFLSSENEWFKAAYYDPRTTAQGGPPADGHYWLYPATSNTIAHGGSPTATPNSANLSPLGPNSPTDVGAYSGTTSPYGAYDMEGNVEQWNESLIGMSRGLRGSGFDTNSEGNSSSTSRDFGGPPDLISDTIGFRVVNIPSGYIPEPSTGMLAIIACGMMWMLRKRFK